MSLNTVRRAFYTAARVLGDVNAVRRHRVIQRLERRTAWRLAGRLLGRLFR